MGRTTTMTSAVIRACQHEPWFHSNRLISAPIPVSGTFGTAVIKDIRDKSVRVFLSAWLHFLGKIHENLDFILNWTRYFKTLMRSVAISVAFVQSHEQIVCKLRGYDCRAQSCSFWTTWLKIEQSERLPKVSCLFKLKFFRSIFLGILSVSLLRKITYKYHLGARLVFWKSRLSRSPKKTFLVCSLVT